MALKVVERIIYVVGVHVPVVVFFQLTLRLLSPVPDARLVDRRNDASLKKKQRLCQTLNVTAIVVSKMTSHCAGTVQMREESESGIRK